MILRSETFALLFIFLSACSPDLSDDPIPPALFDDIIIQLSLPQYVSLATKGYYELNSSGIRGIIIYRKDVATYIAYERNCSFQPNDACATINVDVSGLFLTDPCCGSTFDFPTGYPTGGAAWRPLRRYKTHLDGGVLTITDDVVNP